MTVTVITDTSASMASMAKIRVASALMKFCHNLPAIAGEAFAYLHFKFYALGGLEELDPESFYSAPRTGGQTDFSSLKKLCQESAGQDLRCLLLSDGRYPPEDIKALGHIAGNYPVRLIPVAIGADADEYALRSISSVNRKVFRPEDIQAAVELLCSGRDACPESAARLQSGRE